MKDQLYLKLTLDMHNLRLVQAPSVFVFREAMFSANSWVVELFRTDTSRKVTIEFDDCTFTWERATEEEYNANQSN